ncbi:DNA-binding domain-containing protein [Pseudoflavonifractor hominis]|uniref:Stage 0 sporulation protein A homolog n=1 Tax=Pseudoflavonifractor hominis TaxID=2763059 RepID=A0ABR7HVT7_9FIRM|nr:DNA-binding domain-containing protein [Pseudoflavonifractor hominis]MBC5731546.1 DNA-binding domain-containing protein [Pseudoflavonifractor hominis]
MLFYLIDDDSATLNILRMIIEDSDSGSVIGSAASGLDALEDLRYMRPDIVLVDLLMPGMDGIEFVRQARSRYPDLRFVMLSQVTSKDMVAEAYSAGVDFFLSKPVNSIEVVSVLRKVGKLLTMDRTMDQMRSLLQGGAPAGISSAPTPPPDNSERQQSALNAVLHRIGISGDPACRDISQVVGYLLSSQGQQEQLTVAQLCDRFSDSPKAMEQRIRRAAMAGMVNLANLGIEDYSNDTFTEYAGTLYHFEQVRREMDCIRGKTTVHGRVSVKKFLYALAALCAGR